MTNEDFVLDEQKFQEWVKSKNLDKKRVYFVCIGGIGDHFVAKKVILKILPRLVKYRVIIGATYLKVFWDLDKEIKVVPLDYLKDKIKNLDSFNVYSWMSRHCWNKSMEEAYEFMFKELLHNQSIFI